MQLTFYNTCLNTQMKCSCPSLKLSYPLDLPYESERRLNYTADFKFFVICFKHFTHTPLQKRSFMLIILQLRLCTTMLMLIGTHVLLERKNKWKTNYILSYMYLGTGFKLIRKVFMSNCMVIHNLYRIRSKFPP